MKKALAILLALSMVFAAFADAPAADFAVSISGSAELGWQADLEAEKNGFFNNTEVKAKINLFNGGDVATTGDGIWGELKIKTDKDGHKELEGKNADTPLFGTAFSAVPMVAKVDTAKIYFKEGDVKVALNILKPGLNLGKVVLPTAASGETKSDKFDVNAGSVLAAGFGVEVETAPVNVNIKVMDNGIAANNAKEYGFAADASLKTIENLGLKAGFAYALETTAVVASADYKLAIDDTMYVKPVVAFGMKKSETVDNKQLAAGVLFGWGADGQKPEFALLNKKSDKFADGISVTYKNDLAEEATQEIVIGAYDSTLVEGLKVGAEYKTTLDDFGKGNLATGVKYSTDIDILTISGEFGYTTKVGTKDSDKYIYSAEVKTDKVIDNTTVYGKYEGGKDNKGKITVGAKIAL